MAMTGCLAEFSLPEIFHFVHQGRKTGLLTIHTEPDSHAQQEESHYIWLHQGQIMAVADRLDGQGLLSMISQRRWLGLSRQEVLDFARHCPVDTPIGLCFSLQGALRPDQLRLLFYAQVTRQVCALFKVKNGQFDFDTQAALPKTEMTGLSLSAAEAALLGLRVLRDWESLTDKLPKPTSLLSKVVLGNSNLRLDAQERQVWEHGDGKTALATIAEQLELSTDLVQQIAFRLIAVGLAQEIPLIAPASTMPLVDNIRQPVTESSTKQNASNSFIQNLVSFLRSKV